MSLFGDNFFDFNGDGKIDPAEEWLGLELLGVFDDDEEEKQQDKPWWED